MIRKLRAENFLSWKELEFDFVSGITLIEGQNLDEGSSEGSGKSAIPNALCWGLYGQIPKDVGVDEVIHEGEKSCTITVYLNDDIIVVRKRGPNELFLLMPDGQKFKGKDAKETQRRVQDLIGMSFETFCQAVYSPQNYAKKFITASEEDKAKVFSELQDLSWCDKASKHAAEAAKEQKNQIEKLEAGMKRLESEINVHKTHLKTFVDFDKRFELEKKDEIKALQSRLEGNQTTLDKYQESLAGIGTSTDAPSIKVRLTAAQDALSEVERALNEIKAQQTNYERALKSLNCPTCGQTMPHQHALPKPPADPKSLVEQKNSLKLVVAQINLELETENQRSITRREILFKIELLHSQIGVLKESLDCAKQKSNPYQGKIEHTEKEIERLTGDLDGVGNKINNEYRRLESFSALKEGFKELKSHVFQSLLAELNQKANRYMQELFDVAASVRFSNISEDGEIAKISTAVSINGDERSLGLLSGGQFRRVQLSVDFALSDIVSERGDSPINLRILDEPFKDLSETKMEKVIGLLERMKGSTVIIEHNSMIRSIVNNLYKVELQDKVSRRV